MAGSQIRAGSIYQGRLKIRRINQDSIANLRIFLWIDPLQVEHNTSTYSLISPDSTSS
jgi:hypothetical protein